MRFHFVKKRVVRNLLAMRKNMARFFPLYHEYNAYRFNRRYKKGLAHRCEISDRLSNWLSELREEALALAPEGRIVEIACGDGELTSRLSKYWREAIGLDISAEAIQLAKQYENGNLKFSVHNVERDPLTGENSLIICEDVLYYIPFVSMKKVARKLSEALLRGNIARHRLPS
jgi:SAM-dependent methyltransferase